MDPIISLNLWYIIAAICNVLILYSILKKILFEKVKSFIDEREKEVEKTISEADSAKSQAEKLKQDYEASIADAKNKASDIIKEATATATKRSDAIIAEAHNETTAIKQKAETSIELERKKVMSKLQSDISDLVTTAASKVIQKEINAEDHKKLIQDFVEIAGE